MTSSSNDGPETNIGAQFDERHSKPNPLPPISRERSAGSKAKVKRKAAMSSVNNPDAMSTPAGFAIAEEAQTLLTEANANTQAMVDTINAIIRAETIDDIVRAALDNIRKEFGWVYASYWTVDPVENVLVFSLESGRVDNEFQRLTRTAQFREGEGLTDGAWRLRDLVHFADLGELHDCCRAPLARRAGIKTAIALPVMHDGQVIGTLDFFAIQSVEISQARLAALRTIGQLASDKVSKLAKQADLNRIKQMVENAPVNLLYADLDLKVQYMNRKAEETLKRLEAHLPIKVAQMIGHSIDVFHKAPEHQRRILADPRNLPRTATINVGPELFELIRQRDARQQWQIHRADDHLGSGDRQGGGREARSRNGRRYPGSQSVAPGAGAQPHGPRRDHLGTGIGTRGVQLVVRVVLGDQRRGAGATVRSRRGIGQRRVSPRDSRRTVP